MKAGNSIRSTMRQSHLRPWVIVAKRELNERLRSPMYLVATICLMTVSVLGVVIPHFTASNSRTVSVVVIGRSSAAFGEQNAATLASVEEQFDVRLSVQRADDADRAREAVENKSADIAVIDNEVVVGSTPSRTGRVGRALVAVQIIAQTKDQPAAVVSTLHERSSRYNEQHRLVQIGLVLSYLAVVFYGYWVTAGVNEEKQTRVAEVLIGAVRPSQLLAGKVLGIGLAGFVQFLSIGAVAGAASLAMGNPAPSGTPSTIATFVMWFVLGYAMSCSFYAAAGSLAARSEEASNAATPVTLVLFVGLLGGTLALSQPTSTVVKFLSLLPVSSPLVMPVRSVLGHVSLIELVVAPILCIAFTVFVTRAAARIYRGGIRELRGRTSVATAWRAP